MDWDNVRNVLPSFRDEEQNKEAERLRNLEHFQYLAEIKQKLKRRRIKTLVYGILIISALVVLKTIIVSI
jgi:hypothetical protein